MLVESLRGSDALDLYPCFLQVSVNSSLGFILKAMCHCLRGDTSPLSQLEFLPTLLPLVLK